MRGGIEGEEEEIRDGMQGDGKGEGRGREHMREEKGIKPREIRGAGKIGGGMEGGRYPCKREMQ